MIRSRLGALFLSAFLVVCNGQKLFSQETPGVYKTSDGGTREVLESIFIPPITNAPFSLTLETEWSRPLSGGGSVTVVNRRHIMRDSAGRIYQERWILVPKGGKIESTMNWIQISYPEKHLYYNCDTASKQCKRMPYDHSISAVYKPLIGTSGALPDGSGIRKHEDLGTGSTAGVATVGYRDTTIVNPGVWGNDQPMTTTREFWYSQQLGINLVSTLDSPQTGKQVFTVAEITTSEPDPQFFSIPEGYTEADAKPQE
jgi:hypothetical protein